MKTVSSICPSPKHFVSELKDFVNAEENKALEQANKEFKPLAVNKVISDQSLINKIQDEFAEHSSMESVKDLLENRLKTFCEDLKFEGEFTNKFPPNFKKIAKEILNECFIPMFGAKRQRNRAIKWT